MTYLAARDILCAGPFCNQLQNGDGNAPAALGGQLLGVVVNLALVGGGLMMLLFLLTAAVEWITSGGEKEKISKAQQKMMHAAIGMVILALSWSIWLILVHNILGIFGEGGSFNLPKLGGN
jgi:hypothetical protein